MILIPINSMLSPTAYLLESVPKVRCPKSGRCYIQLCDCESSCIIVSHCVGYATCQLSGCAIIRKRHLQILSCFGIPCHIPGMGQSHQ